MMKNDEMKRLAGIFGGIVLFSVSIYPGRSYVLSTQAQLQADTSTLERDDLIEALSDTFGLTFQDRPPLLN